MKKVLAYDYPTRLFHWGFALIFVAIFIIAKTIDDESLIFSYHMLLGLLLAVIALARILWGFFGGTHARFSSFALHPKELLEYFTAIFTGKTKLYVGHNPASSWAAILMIIFSLGLAFTGIQMAQDNNKHFFEEIHEFLSHAFLFTAITHVLGIVFHTLRHKDLIAMSMIHGQKSTDEVQPLGITNKHPLIAFLFLVLIIVTATSLFSNFNSQTRVLNLFGNQLTLGETQDSSEQNDIKEDSDHDD